MTAKTLFVITITTARMFMPGMSDMPKIPGMTMPDMSAPTRTLTMDLTSPQKPEKQFKAECAVPEGLKVGPKVDLHIDLPEKVSKDLGKPEESNETPGKTPEMTFKTYWSCAEKVPAGQPKVMDTKAMVAAAQKAMKNGKMPEHMGRILSTDGTHAYWPYGDFKGIDKAATAPGDYDLTTNYCGDTSVKLARNQDFLAAIELTKPGKGGADTVKAIPIEWKSVPNAKAYLLMAFAAKDNEMVTWTSSSDPEVPSDIQFRAVSNSDLEKYIEKGILLPADATSCCIPAGVFKGFDNPMLTVIAFGADKIQDKDGIETQVLIRSTATSMLGAGMGMAMDDNPDDPAEVKPVKDDNNPEEISDNQDSGDAADQANDALNKADEVGDALKRVKGIFKRR
ncbi:MAG: hypothetical protein ACYC64_07475 [Armatimonadota bacterium]